VQLRREKTYLANFRHGDDAVEVPVRARTKAEAERRAKKLVADALETPLLGVRRESWYARRTRATAPTAKDNDRRVVAVTLVAGLIGTAAVVLLAAQASSAGA
jgi:hypothetical protein